MRKKEMNDKGSITWDTMIPYIIGVTVLVLVIVFAFLLKDKLIAMGHYAKNLFR